MTNPAKSAEDIKHDAEHFTYSNKVLRTIRTLASFRDSDGRDWDDVIVTRTYLLDGFTVNKLMELGRLKNKRFLTHMATPREILLGHLEGLGSLTENELDGWIAANLLLTSAKSTKDAGRDPGLVVRDEEGQLRVREYYDQGELANPGGSTEIPARAVYDEQGRLRSREFRVLGYRKGWPVSWLQDPAPGVPAVAYFDELGHETYRAHCRKGHKRNPKGGISEIWRDAAGSVVRAQSYSTGFGTIFSMVFWALLCVHPDDKLSAQQDDEFFSWRRLEPRSLTEKEITHCAWPARLELTPPEIDGPG